MAAAKARDVTPLVAKLRNFLLQTKYNQALRFELDQVPRTQPPAKLPPGVSHSLSENYYHSRDARRCVQPPTVVYESGKTLLAAGEQGETAVAAKPPRLPGLGYNWETGRDSF